MLLKKLLTTKRQRNKKTFGFFNEGFFKISHLATTQLYGKKPWVTFSSEQLKRFEHDHHALRMFDRLTTGDVR